MFKKQKRDEHNIINKTEENSKRKQGSKIIQGSAVDEEGKVRTCGVPLYGHFVDAVCRAESRHYTVA